MNYCKAASLVWMFHTHKTQRSNIFQPKIPLRIFNAIKEHSTAGRA